MRHKILVVDDEPDVIELLGVHLHAAGFQMISSGDGASALAKAQAGSPSLIVLDLGLPKIQGFEVCRQLKRAASTQHIPIIILTARATETHRITGFELGADDYVTKPFSPRELVLRIRKSLHRNLENLPTEKKLTVGDLVLDPVRHEVALHDKPIYLTVIEFRLLALLMEHCGSVLDRQTLLHEIWGNPSATISRTLDKHISRLRPKLGSMSRNLESISGVGYRLNQNLPASFRERESRPSGPDDVDCRLERLERASDLMSASRVPALY